ncbi:NADH:flavin oxidoreductase [Paenibacillus qinlingensis]|uniref:2,4-dienoyl-CoA reductase-like NADH-dependent reductase (Old Yellow Enzyme family) n=1 Tax=Paenibacillus qinlingensis TaxID=1837343 RepID=A0ABU1P142_9BACL|nr:NADH:flavin oxidoreductase [Paenibacillus qinlingensis]MDR6553464.1 2,4-dienoyl-CoA reductase-like NADH-dependent reductase (Old Yellow Enzyme family) [Paenibacillus qinlingensis]
MTNSRTNQETNSVEALFKPFTLGNLSLANRVVMAPMTRAFSPEAVPGQDVVDYYRRRAENGVGLIITEGTLINHPAATDNPNIPNIHGEAALAGWKRVVDAVHEAGGRIVPQLWHVGMTRKNGSLPHPEALSIGPSGLTLTGEQVNEPMTQADIDQVVEAFAQAAADAKRIGFDGIELHGAHGYLIDQFLWERTNQRTDKYGGSMLARTRFAVEVIEACRRAVGPDFPIIIRLSQWKSAEYTAKLADTPELLGQLLAPLVEAGVDIFHCSTRRFWEPEFEGSELNFAGWVKQLTGKPTITVGSVGLDDEFMGSFRGKSAGTADINELLVRLEQNEFDLVAIGRALLVDPNWVEKVRDGRFDELLPFTVDALKRLY